MIRGLGYITLLVEDWPGMLGFYRDVLGLKVEAVDAEAQWALLAVGGARLVLLPGGFAIDTIKGVDRNCFVPNFQVDDVEATYAQLRRGGVRFQTDVRATETGYRIATAIDPEGNRFQVYDWRRPPRGHDG